MLPFALLGLVVLDGVPTRLPAAADVAARLVAHWPVTVYGFATLLVVEAVLRTVELVFCR
jgi:hypothetical protein